MKLIMRQQSKPLSHNKTISSATSSQTPLDPSLFPLQMAEAVLFVLATDILKSLAAEMVKPGGSFASQNIQWLYGAKDELQSLEGTVQTIQAVLLDAEKQQWHNNQVKLWLKRLKEVLYDVQDLLDDVATEDLRQKVTYRNMMSKEVWIFFSKSNQLAHRLKVARKIQELRRALDRIENDNKFNFELHPSEETMAIGRGKKTEFSAPDREIIGRKQDKENIIKLLFESSSSQNVSVVSIIGKGGLGKTALARLVYNDEKVKGHFGLKMWVCVSDVFDVNLIIKEILNSAKADYEEHDYEMEKLLKNLETKPIDQLQSLLHDTLGRKKYLLVLDDLWNEERFKWLKLGDWLKGGVQGSKILVTTRCHSVAKVTDANSALYDLKGLSRDRSWDLFRKVAFGDVQDSIDKRLEKIGRDIVRKCAGVPLAIRTIASLLYNKKQDEWLRYKVHAFPDILETDAVDEGIMQVLKFSYDHLPSCLKHCFAYCSLFPKGYIYNKETMIHLWVAQGFIKSPNGEDNLEEVAANYLSGLLCKSFLDAAMIGHNGEVLAFKMHDLMHDLAQKVAGGECKIVNEGRVDGGIRHVSFISEIFSQEKMVSLLKTSKLRTFLYLEGDGLGRESSGHDCHNIFSAFSHCRVLGLGKMDIRLSPSSIGKLKHLRFLDISENQSIQILPDSIVGLLNLQTLKLSGCKKLITLPRDLSKLVNLRHLLIDGCESLSHMPCGLDRLSLLQTLSQYVPQKTDYKVPGGVGRVDELGGLNRLAGPLSLEKLEFLQPATNKGHLREKQHLRSLVLTWSREHQDDTSDRDELIIWENLRPHPNLTCLTVFFCMCRSPPSWLSSIKNLAELKLHDCKVWKYLPPLGGLPSLRTMDLMCLDALEFIQEVSYAKPSNAAFHIFPSLERLFLYGCNNLKGWWGSRQLLGVDQIHPRNYKKSPFPKLRVVQTMYCPQLNSVPLSFGMRTFIDGVSGSVIHFR